MVSGRDDVAARRIKLLADLVGDAEAVRRVLAVDDDEIESEGTPQVRLLRHHGIASRAPNHVAAKQQPHAETFNLCVRGTNARRAR